MDLLSLEGSGGLPLELESIVDVSVGAPALRFNPNHIGVKYPYLYWLGGDFEPFLCFALQKTDNQTNNWIGRKTDRLIQREKVYINIAQQFFNVENDIHLMIKTIRV